MNTKTYRILILSCLMFAFFTVPAFSAIYTGNTDWKKIGAELPNGDIYGIATNSKGHLFAAVGGESVFRMTDGKTWEALEIEASPTSLYISENDYIFMGATDVVFRSVDNGDTWEEIYKSISYSGQVIAFATGADGRIFAAGMDSWAIHYTDDNGDTWTPATEGLTNRFIRSLAADDQGRLLATAQYGPGGTIFYSTDNGESWTNVTQNVPNYGRAAAISSEGALFVGVVFWDIYRSMDEGENWERLSGDFGGTEFRELLFTPDGKLYTAIWNKGIFVSADNGEDWTNTSNDLPGNSIQTLYYDEPSNAMFTGVNGEGIFKIEEIATSLSDPGSMPQSFALGQNYPNPFNPSTVISFQLPVSSFVRLEVFDMLGRKVAILVNEQLSAGYHEVNFNASHLASGIYLYRITTNKRSSTKSMTLIK